MSQSGLRSDTRGPTLGGSSATVAPSEAVPVSANAVDCGRFAALASHAVQSRCVKRLRLVGRASQASTVPAEVFDLADDDSDTDSVNSREEQVLAAPRPIDSPVVVEEGTDDEDAESVGFSVSDDTVSVIEDPADVAVPRAPALRDAFRAMDDVDVERIFTLRASVMRSVPRFLHGPFRNAMKMILEEILNGVR